MKGVKLFAALMAVLFAAKVAEGIPAFARRFVVKCVMCHNPVPPRLNNIGITFKRMGYRLPDTDPKGRLFFKPGFQKNWDEAFSLITELQLSRISRSGSGVEEHEGEEVGHIHRHALPSRNGAHVHGGAEEEGRAGRTVKLNFEGVELFGAAAMTPSFSYEAMLTFSSHLGSSLGTSLHVGNVQWNFFDPENTLHLRLGQVAPLLWQKGDHQSLTLSMPLVFSRAVPVGNFSGFSPAVRQRGIEVGYTINRLATEGNLSSTQFSLALLSGVEQSGRGERRGFHGFHFDGSRDLLAQVVHLWGSDNSISAFFYRGKSRIRRDDEGKPIGPFRNRITRLGIMGNHTFSDRFDLLAGYVWGRDDSSELRGHVVSRGFFVELSSLLWQKEEAETTVGRTLATLRFDYFNPGKPGGGDRILGYTLSFTRQLGNSAFATLEWQRLTGGGARDNRLSAQVSFVY